MTLMMVCHAGKGVALEKSDHLPSDQDWKAVLSLLRLPLAPGRPESKCRQREEGDGVQTGRRFTYAPSLGLLPAIVSAEEMPLAMPPSQALSVLCSKKASGLGIREGLPLCCKGPCWHRLDSGWKEPLEGSQSCSQLHAGCAPLPLPIQRGGSGLSNIPPRS